VTKHMQSFQEIFSFPSK